MTSTRDVSIADLVFKVTLPYEEGHQISAAEAKALNQTRVENISNSLRKRLNALKAEDGSYSDEALSAAAELFNAFDASYNFTISSGGSTRVTLDPLTKEARIIARAHVTAAIKEKGIALKDYDKEKFEGLVDSVAANEQVVALARKRLEERAEMAKGIKFKV